MKRIVIILASALVATTTIAQSTNKMHITFGAEMGVSTFFNYPRLSLTETPQASYTAPSTSFNLGLRDSTLEIGVRYRLTDISTGAENINMHDLSVMVHRSAMVAPHLELFGGVTTGFAIQQNRFCHNGDYLTASQYGISAAFEVGMRYYLSSNTFLSLTASIGTTVMFDRSLNLPSDIDLSNHHGITYAMASICVGFGIGFPPKVKKINMPSALIDHDNRHLLASYR